MGLRSHELHALGKLALADGVVTADEQADLLRVAEMLGLTTEDVSRPLDPTECGDAGGRDICRFSLVAGDAVVFTGEAPGIERLELEYQAKSLGLRVTSAVSGKTRLVVAADPDSISGKARKARDLGIPIVDYASYLTMLDSLSC